MCGRFANDAETNELIEEFVAQGGDFRDWRPQFSIAPTELVPIVRERQDAASGELTRSVIAAEWDFHPPFLTAKSRPQFNARIETIAVNGLWKSAFAGGRCIVPMRGYYEWTGDKGDKQRVLDLLEAVSAQVASTITTYEVDRRVNNSRTIDPADPTLIEPLAG